MTREEHQDRAQHASGEERASEDFLARVRAETAGGAPVMSDATGRWFWWRCSRCGSRGPEHRDKTQPAIQARHHEDRCS